MNPVRLQTSPEKKTYEFSQFNVLSLVRNINVEKCKVFSQFLLNLKLTAFLSILEIYHIS